MMALLTPDQKAQYEMVQQEQIQGNLENFAMAKMHEAASFMGLNEQQKR